jgi:hypothetical protein
VFKAIELDTVAHRRTGRAFELRAETREAAIEALVELLGIARADAEVDPGRRVVKVGTSLWTLIAASLDQEPDPPGLRRAGAKHKRVR